MTQYLPPYLLALFAPRDPFPYLAPVDKLPHEKKRQPYTGLADYLDQFEDPEETPPPVKIETKQERLERKRREKAEQNAYKIEQDLAMWNPKDNQDATYDPYKTLFVARINYDSSESKLRREFEVYGKIKQIKLVHDIKTGKPRGYAFIEYEDENSMHAAYKRADGKKIDGRRVVVDIERGRTIKGWKPRRLGGGKAGRKSHYDPMVIDRIPDGYGVGEVDRFDDKKSRDRERDRDRDRESNRERPKRSKSRSKSRDRKKRSKSKDKHRSRSRERAKKSRRSRSKDGKSSRKRSRSREKNRDKREKSVESERFNGNGDGITNNMNGTPNNGTEYGEIV